MSFTILYGSVVRKSLWSAIFEGHGDRRRGVGKTWGRQREEEEIWWTEQTFSFCAESHVLSSCSTQITVDHVPGCSSRTSWLVCILTASVGVLSEGLWEAGDVMSLDLDAVYTDIWIYWNISKATHLSVCSFLHGHCSVKYFFQDYVWCQSPGGQDTWREDSVCKDTYLASLRTWGQPLEPCKSGRRETERPPHTCHGTCAPPHS